MNEETKTGGLRDAGEGSAPEEEAGREKDEFAEDNRKEKKKKDEALVRDLWESEEVISALLGAREAAEKAVAHMEGRACEGETEEDMMIRRISQLKATSVHNFLQNLNLIGMQEHQKKKRKEAKNSPYSDFIQLNNKNLDFLIRLVDEQPQAMKILLFIIQNMDGYNALVCSYAVLEERFKMSHSTVWRHVKYLKDHKYIDVQKTGSSNVYVLTPELAWRSYGKNIQYCKFPANVMISYSEQKKDDGSKSIRRKRGKVELKDEDAGVRGKKGKKNKGGKAAEEGAEKERAGKPAGERERQEAGK